VLVKMSYFPNWRVTGADGPYRVAPNFMVVVPHDTEVELTYGRTWVEYLAYALTLAGVVGLVLLARRPAYAFTGGRPDDGGPGDEGAGDGRPGDGRPGDGRPGDGRPGDGGSPDGREVAG
jgi:hypothetical protein